MSVGDQDDSIAATTPQNGSTKREKESTPPLPSNSSSSKTSKRPRKTRQPDVGQQVTKEKTVAGHPYGCNTCAERKGTLSELREHLKTVHTTALDDLEKPYRCAGCHRTYKVDCVRSSPFTFADESTEPEWSQGKRVALLRLQNEMWTEPGSSTTSQ